MEVKSTMEHNTEQLFALFFPVKVWLFLCADNEYNLISDKKKATGRYSKLDLDYVHKFVVPLLG